ncbi:hypothetical protein BG015_010901 [Linnemannia schmuckeri]|uniref:HCP-like protein n=1 Tax=Linnemannia schmuckeri TaxID=64567 RepID=A0A9P5RVW0_9FUNG|nr:hypothetical protein BG015_010901 [Linnemannia schmuckeri]
MLQADSAASQEPQLVLAVRSVNKDQALSSIASAKPDDIFLESRGIAALSNTVLDVIVSGLLVNARVTSSLRGSMQEEEKKSGKDVVASQSVSITSMSTVKRNPVYNFENTAMDKYTHIDQPMSPQNATAISNSDVRRNPVYGLENTAMDNYSHIDHPALRGSQALLDEQTSTNTGLALPPTPYTVNAPQSTTTTASKEMTLVQTIISASHGDKVAQVALGNMYKEGQGVYRDYQSAMDWYLRAADQSFARAQPNIGVLYHNGQGVPQDFAKAMEWFLKAADQGFADAQFNVGLLYDKGLGVPQDPSKAMEWYQKAVEQRDSDAEEVYRS